MKRTIVILPFVIGLLGLTVGCDQRAERWLDMAEACMETNSDSAYRCLSQMDAMEGLSDRHQARYALLRTQAMHKCRMPLGSDSLINVAVICVYTIYTGRWGRWILHCITTTCIANMTAI